MFQDKRLFLDFFVGFNISFVHVNEFLAADCENLA